MRRKIKDHLLPFSIFAFLTPVLSVASALSYYVIGVMEVAALNLPRGGVVALLTLGCFVILNLLFLILDLLCSIYAISALKTQKNGKHICCTVFSLLGLLLSIILWILAI